MALTSFDLTLEGTLHEGTTSEDSAVARAIIGVDELLTSAARALYGYLGDPEVIAAKINKVAAQGKKH